MNPDLHVTSEEPENKDRLIPNHIISNAAAKPDPTKPKRSWTVWIAAIEIGRPTDKGSKRFGKRTVFLIGRTGKDCSVSLMIILL